MNHPRTFAIDRLYHQFLKPRKIPRDRLPFLVSELFGRGFIEVYQSPEGPDAPERYSENEKFQSGQHRVELFAILTKLE